MHEDSIPPDGNLYENRIYDIDTSLSFEASIHPEDTHQARLVAGAACHAAAVRLHGLGLSPLRLCDPQHIGVERIVKTHGDRCMRPGKAPLLSAWKEYQQRQPPLAEIDGWWDEYRIGNVGLVLGLQIVRIDVDSEEAHKLLQEWSADDLPETWEFLSPSTPYPQYLYAWPESLPPAKTYVETLEGEHNELRLMGLGFQTAMPPSRHVNGGVYRWKDGKSPDDIPLAPAPAWLTHRMTQQEKHGERVPRKVHPEGSQGTPHALRIKRKMLQQIRDAEKGTRHDTRLRVGETIGGLISSGELPESAEDELVDVARAHSEHPDNAERDIRDALHHGKERPFVPSETGHISNEAVWGDMEPVGDAPLVDKIPLSDVYNSQRLVKEFGASIHYCGVWKKILVYHNGVWRTDHDGKVVEYAKAVAKGMHDRAVRGLDEEKKKAATATVDPMSEEESESPLDAAKAYLKHAIKAHSAASIHNMIELAKSIDPLPISHDVLGIQHNLLPTLNCVVDLKTGAMLPHSPHYLFTGCVPVVFDPQAACPRWEQFLLELMGYTIGPDSPDDSKAVLDAREKADERARELVAYLKRVLGYCLTGLTKEQALFFFYGDGANGKSALFEILLKLLGDDFGKKGTANFLMVKKHDAHPTEQADLYRKRLVVVPETEKGARLSEVLVRELTGSDQITARHMNEDFWSFWPTHKFIIGTNHLPTFRDMSYAMRRRLQMVPFGVTFYDRDALDNVPAHARDDPHTAWADKNLSVALLNELPGILAWIVQGAVEWHASGIQPPAEVLSATKGYFDSQDVVQRFIDDCCYTGDKQVDVTKLWDAFKKWADDGNEQGRFTRTMFKEAMEAKGYEQGRTEKRRYWSGVGLPEITHEAPHDKTHDKMTNHDK